MHPDDPRYFGVGDSESIGKPLQKHSDTITVLFNCGQCGATKVPVDVVKRQGDLIQWLHGHVMQAVALKHNIASPDCKANTCELMIPIPKDGEGIGTS